MADVLLPFLIPLVQDFSHCATQIIHWSVLL